MSDGKRGKRFDDYKNDMMKCAESLLNEIKNFIKEDNDEEDRTETLYGIKSFAEGIMDDAYLLLNKEYYE